MAKTKITTVELDGEYSGSKVLSNFCAHHPYFGRKFRVGNKIGTEVFFYRCKDEECKKGIIRDSYPMFTLLLIDPEKKYQSVQIKTYYAYMPRWLHILRHLWITFFVKTDDFGKNQKRLLRDPAILDEDLEKIIATFKDFLSRK